jgi:hypothetical protein
MDGVTADQILRARGFRWDFLLETYLHEATRRIAYIVGNGVGKKVSVQIFKVKEDV